MLVNNTPTEHYPEFNLWVKREDLSCPDPGPHFSKTRGVFAHIAKLPHKVIGVLDTFHSQAGHAVAYACKMLGKECINYYPQYVQHPGLRKQQLDAQALGAKLVPLPAGRSCILFHQAKHAVESVGGYMMPNALKLHESVDETESELRAVEIPFNGVLIPSSSATIAAGVVKGLVLRGTLNVRVLIHLGYSRSEHAVREYVHNMSGKGYPDSNITIIDEGYEYKDTAVDGITPPWPCNPYYDLKAFRWWLRTQALSRWEGNMLFWNIG